MFEHDGPKLEMYSFSYVINDNTDLIKQVGKYTVRRDANVHWHKTKQQRCNVIP